MEVNKVAVGDCQSLAMFALTVCNRSIIVTAVLNFLMALVSHESGKHLKAAFD